MGVVVEGALPDGEAVAIKLPHAKWLGDERAMRRFRDEGTAGSIVCHRNLVSVRGHGTTEDGLPFLVMDRVRGEPLGQQVHRDGAPSLRRVCALVTQVLRALEAMHAAGIVHGDVKSDNVLVERQDDGSEHATLIDLGLARVQFGPQDVVAVAPDETVVSGTPDYMAPEVIGGNGASAASDLYAVGVILYELITGSTPFGGGTASEVVARHLDEDVVPPSLRCERVVPPVLERIVLRALEKDPARRFRSATAFLAALEVARPCLDDDLVATPACHVLSTDAPTIEWTPSPAPRRRLARGTPRVMRR
jgi:serine/threonine-protein kinase